MFCEDSEYHACKVIALKLNKMKFPRRPLIHVLRPCNVRLVKQRINSFISVIMVSWSMLEIVEMVRKDGHIDMEKRIDESNRSCICLVGFGVSN